MDRKRNRRTCMRLSDDEYETMRSRANLAGLSLTDFVVQRCVDDRVSFTLERMPGTDERLSVKRTRSKRTTREKQGAFYIRCSLHERETIIGLAEEAKMALSDYVILSALNKKVTVIKWDGEQDLKAGLRELAKQGTNLNQIAYRMNRLTSITWREDVSGELIDQLVREITEDNERTRTHINDAIKAFTDTIRMITHLQTPRR